MWVFEQIKNVFSGKREEHKTMFPERFHESGFYSDSPKSQYIPPKYRRFLDMKFDFNSMFILSRYIMERTGNFLPEEREEIVKNLCIMEKMVTSSQDSSEVSEENYRKFYFFYNELIETLMNVERVIQRKKPGYRFKITDEMKRHIH